jgi:integrase
LADLDFAHLQRREEHWAIVDLVGKGGQTRTVPLPDWVKNAIDVWTLSAGISAGRLFRRVCRAGKYWGDGVTERVVWHVVKEYAKRLGLGTLAPHDLRRSCAKLCPVSGGELEQIQFLLGHASVQATELYLGWKQRISGAVNDRIGIEPYVLLSHSDDMPTNRQSE